MEDELVDEQVDYDDIGEFEEVTKETVNDVRKDAPASTTAKGYVMNHGKVSNKIFVSRFSPGLKTADFMDHFSAFGVVLSVNLSRFGDFAFIEFENTASAEKACRECHRQPILGSSSLICDFKSDGKKHNPNGHDRSGYVRGEVNQ